MQNVMCEVHIIFFLMGYLLFPIFGFPEIICRGLNVFRIHKLELNIVIFCVIHCCIRIRSLQVLKNVKLSLFVVNWPEGLCLRCESPTKILHVAFVISLPITGNRNFEEQYQKNFDYWKSTHTWPLTSILEAAVSSLCVLDLSLSIYDMCFAWEGERPT